MAIFLNNVSLVLEQLFPKLLDPCAHAIYCLLTGSILCITVGSVGSILLGLAQVNANL